MKNIIKITTMLVVSFTGALWAQEVDWNQKSQQLLTQASNLKTVDDYRSPLASAAAQEWLSAIREKKESLLLLEKKQMLSLSVSTLTSASAQLQALILKQRQLQDKIELLKVKGSL